MLTKLVLGSLGVLTLSLAAVMSWGGSMGVADDRAEQVPVPVCCLEGDVCCYPGAVCCEAAEVPACCEQPTSCCESAQVCCVDDQQL